MPVQLLFYLVNGLDLNPWVAVLLPLWFSPPIPVSWVCSREWANDCMVLSCLLALNHNSTQGSSIKMHQGRFVLDTRKRFFTSAIIFYVWKHHLMSELCYFTCLLSTIKNISQYPLLDLIKWKLQIALLNYHPQLPLCSVIYWSKWFPLIFCTCISTPWQSVGSRGLQGWALSGDAGTAPCWALTVPDGSSGPTKGHVWAPLPQWWCSRENIFQKWQSASCNEENKHIRNNPVDIKVRKSYSKC